MSAQTAWTPWKWDISGGYWWAIRRNENGAIEHNYHIPNEPRRDDGNRNSSNTYGSKRSAYTGGYITSAPHPDYYEHSILPASSTTTCRSDKYGEQRNASDTLGPTPVLGAQPPGMDFMNTNPNDPKMNASNTTENANLFPELSKVASPLELMSLSSTPETDWELVESVQTRNNTLDPQFRVQEATRFFKVGRVFRILWSEPAGITRRGTIVESTRSDKSSSSTSLFGEPIFAKIRRFVIVSQCRGHCLCLPIMTYEGRGTMKPGVDSKAHAAVYPADGKPLLKPGETLGKDPFPIIIEAAKASVDAMSRINFSKVYTVEYNVKVANVGRIPPSHLDKLMEYSPLKA